MNVEQFKTNVTEALETVGVAIDKHFREADTVSDLMPLMSALWLKALPDNLSERLREWSLETFTERTLGDYGVLVNPTEVAADHKTHPWLVLLDGSERQICQAYDDRVAYRGGALTDIQVVKGSADLRGQRSADCLADSFVLAKRVAKVLAHDQSKVEAKGCPLVIGSDEAKLVLHDSYGETTGACRCIVEFGGRLLSAQSEGAIKVDWGGMLLQTDNDKIGFGEGVILSQSGISDGAYSELIPRMKLLSPLTDVRYHPEISLGQLKEFYQSGIYKTLHNGYELVNNQSLIPLIEQASSKTELACLLLPYTHLLIKSEPVDCLIERFAPELLAAYNILTPQTPHLALNGAFPVHVFGNMAVDVALLGKSVYCHDSSIGIARSRTSMRLSEQAAGIVMDNGKVNAVDRSFGLLLGDSIGSFKGESRFVAKGDAMAVANDRSQGTGLERAVVHGLGYSKVQLKDHSTGYLSYNSQALVWGPEVQFIADGFSWAYVKGETYGLNHECRDHAVKTRVIREPEWENLVKSFESDVERKQNMGRKV